MPGVSVRCPRCGNVNLVPAAAVPTPVRCPICKGGYLAPAAVVPPPPPPPLPSELPKPVFEPAFTPAVAPRKAAAPQPAGEPEPPPVPATPSMGRWGAVLLGLLMLLLLGGGVVGVAVLVVWLKSSSPASEPVVQGPASPPSTRNDPNIVWISASKGAMLESIRVKVTHLEFGEVLARDERNNPVSAGSGDFLKVYVQIENSGNGDLSYASWQGNRFEEAGEMVVAQLSDEEGHTWQPHKFDGFQRIRGHTPQATLSRGSIASDVLVFAVPKATVDAANALWLELPAGAFARATSGGDRPARGFFRFEIDADMLSEL